MIDKRMDIDRQWPELVERKSALERLLELVPEKDARPIWEELIAPLYERLRLAQQWPGGKCRTCGAMHPKAKRPSQPTWAVKHQTYCSKYIGPLKHQAVRSDSAPITGEPRAHCACGQMYRYWADQDAKVKAKCPDHDIDWRGPRPLL
jgi:hypothetical protein